MLDQRWRGGSAIPNAVMGVGVGLFVAVVATQVAFNVSAPRDLLTPNVVVSVATVSPFALGMVYGGDFVRTSDLDERRYPRIGTWCGGGLAGFLGLNLVMIVVWPPGGLANVIGWVLFAASVGGGGGLAIGIVEARAIERARRAERVTVRAEHLDAQREWLDYLNSLLRHEVLNNANVIEGYASILAREHDDTPTADKLDVIQAQSRRMIDVIDDVRVLVEAADVDPELDPVRLGELLTEEANDLRESYPDADIDVSVPEGTRVRADGLLGRVFANLLSNAIEHNDGDRPRVWVTAERAGETVLVRVRDDGPGIPEGKRDRLFDREGARRHGLGLYLVRTLVERYDGTVELTDTGPGGSTFTVELPACPDGPVATAGAAGGAPTAVAMPGFGN
jgi:two-component system OmpR family sensor kinase